MTQSTAFPFERFLNVRAAGGPTFSPDGGRVAFVTDITGVPEVWAVGVQGGWPEQLTFGGERVNFARYAPQGGQLVFGADTGGNELQQLYLLSADGAAVRDLTCAPAAMNYWGGWSPDGRQIAFASNRRDPRFFDIYTCDVQTGETACVYASDGMTHAAGFSPDGRWLLLTRVNGSLDEDLLLLDVATRRVTLITPHEGKAVYHGMSWSADSRGLYLATDQGRQTAALVFLDIVTRQMTLLDAPAWDVEAVALSRAGRLAYSVNVDGVSELRLLDVTTGERPSVPGGLPAGVIGVLPICRDPMAGGPLAWSPDGQRLAVSFSSGTNAPNVWLVDLAGDCVTRLTHSSLAGLPQDVLVEPDLIRYPTFDGREVPALYYRLRGGEGQLPIVVFVHGGPEGQSRPNFNPVIAYFVNRGYAVLAPNVRGSTGYGREYSHLDDVEKRMDSVADLAHGVEWLVAHGGADPKRIAVMGASYGGFMVLAAITSAPDLWAAGVDIVGIGNFVTFLERTGVYRRKHRETEYGSLERDRAFLERISPIHKVGDITAPLLVIHGANDPRVPVYEAEQMVAALKARQHPVEYLRFEDEGHGIVKLANRIVAYGAIGDFLDRTLGAPASPAA
ncbi:MAG: S9 family peptidase [Anaerolineae bacterium]